MKLIDIDQDQIDTRDVWIPMPDGVRLHARVWLPRDAQQHPVPAILEYLPYRLDDWTSVRDSERHPYYAANGYASIRVDVRGSGSSEGLFDDEYSAAELDDGIRVIEWLAEQPWCSGDVGMFGISWGGFNSLQLAARGPEALKAIVTVCSTDDRYDNDVHYMGGAVLAIDMAAWAGTMLAFASRPPRPEVTGDGWVEQWRERLTHQRPLAETWLAHQERDDYWRHGSACEDYDSFRAAVLAVGGWSDPYRDTVLRLLENLEVPTKGIIGPWSHQYPDRGLAPGPGMDFLGETLRWWDRWLKGADTGVRARPRPARVGERPGRARHLRRRAAGPLGRRRLAGRDPQTRGAAGHRPRDRRFAVEHRAGRRALLPVRQRRRPAAGSARRGRPFDLRRCRRRRAVRAARARGSAPAAAVDARSGQRDRAPVRRRPRRIVDAGHPRCAEPAQARGTRPFGPADAG